MMKFIQSGKYNDSLFCCYLSKFIQFFKMIIILRKWSLNQIKMSINSSDDHQILKWNAKTRQSQEIAKLPEDFNPTDLHWLCTTRSSNSGKLASGSVGAGNSKGTDALLISSSDGRFVILNRNARVERNVAAHQAAINCIRWSPDGSGLLTAGEDGIIKVWSKLGMLRSTIIQNEKPIRCACWSPNSLSIAYTTGGYIAIKPLAANSKLMKV